MQEQMNSEELWIKIKNEALELTKKECFLSSFYHASIISHHQLSSSLSYILAQKLQTDTIPAILIREVIEEAFLNQEEILEGAIHDIISIVKRDPAIHHHCVALLYLKGFHAIQTHRIAHYLWTQNRNMLALSLQSQASLVFNVDIHPAAKIGHGIMFDHATGIVIGETAIISNNVSIMQSVTLGGTGNALGNRHPKVEEGVLIGAGAKVLGNITIGKGAKIGAGSIVLKDVRPHTTVVGIPAKEVDICLEEMPAYSMNQNIFKG